MRKTAIFLMGPTAVGKTEIAIKLAQQYPVDIISVDSAMIFRGLDIGTGKPSAAVLSAVPHSLINICEPPQSYSVANFYNDAKLVMEQSIANNRVPLLVGGTMMYFWFLQHGLAELPMQNPGLRDALDQKANTVGWPALHQELARLDAASAARIHPNDQQRIQRALEVVYITNKPYSEQLSMQRSFLADWQVKQIALLPASRAELHQAIGIRFRQMLANGLVEEVRNLMDLPGMRPELPAMRLVGYRQVIEFLQHKIDAEQMLQNAMTATRRLAKRQFTWLRKWGNMLVHANVESFFLVWQQCWRSLRL